jgi:anthranilate 1,2-dioxygenase reductase subunit
MSKHNLKIVFEDGRVVQLEADEEQTVHMACLLNRIRILTDCLEGACATCKALCTQGDYRLDEHSEDALSKSEAERRYVLTCQMHLTSDCVIEYAYDSRVILNTEPETFDSRVTGIEQVSSTVHRLVLEPVAGETGEVAPIDFLPGQYVHLGIPGSDQKRSYSFANPPANSPDGAEAMEFFIKLLDGGVMSEYVSGAAKIGDVVPVTGPFGRFYLRPPERPLVMVAGGTGLAPMLSMLDHLVRNGGCDQPIHLLCGANTPDELFCRDRIEAYAGQGLGLATEFAVVEPDGGWQGAAGHVTGLLRPDLVAEGSDVYLCGPPPMIEAGQSWLADQGVDQGRIHVEKFLPS